MSIISIERFNSELKKRIDGLSNEKAYDYIKEIGIDILDCYASSVDSIIFRASMRFEKMRYDEQFNCLTKMGINSSKEKTKKVNKACKIRNLKVNTAKVASVIASCVLIGGLTSGISYALNCGVPFKRDSVMKYETITEITDTYGNKECFFEYDTKKYNKKELIIVDRMSSENGINMGEGRQYKFSDISEDEYQDIVAKVSNGLGSVLNEYDYTTVKIELPSELNTLTKEYMQFKSVTTNGSYILEEESREQNVITSVIIPICSLMGLSAGISVGDCMEKMIDDGTEKKVVKILKKR